jgi:hypothetical protein
VNYFSHLALNSDPPDRCLQSSYDYRRKPPAHGIHLISNEVGHFVTFIGYFHFFFEPLDILINVLRTIFFQFVTSILKLLKIHFSFICSNLLVFPKWNPLGELQGWEMKHGWESKRGCILYALFRTSQKLSVEHVKTLGALLGTICLSL